MRSATRIVDINKSRPVSYLQPGSVFAKINYSARPLKDSQAAYMKHYCLYCGHESAQERQINPKYRRNRNFNFNVTLLNLLGFNTDGYYYIAEDSREFICSDCQLIISQTDFEKDNERVRRLDSEKDTAAPAAPPDERETLSSALKLIKANRAPEALELLYKHSYPFKHPAEFVICRNVCQLIPLLSGTEVGQRYRILEVLQHNVGHLDYYLPADDEEAVFKTLNNIYNLLLHLGREPINCLTDYNTYHRTYVVDIDQTNSRRAEVLVEFAKRLEEESQKSAAHSLEYLKRAVELWHTCLDESRETHGNSLLCIDTQMLQISPSRHRFISARIKQLNSVISAHDPSFTPREPQKKSWYISSLGYLIGAFAATALFILIPCLDYKLHLGIPIGAYRFVIFLGLGVVFAYAAYKQLIKR